MTRGVDQPEVEGYQRDGWKLIMIAKLNTNGTFHSRKWSCVWRPDVGSSLYARSDWMRAGGVGGVAWLQTGAVQSYSYGTGGAEVHVPLADHMGNVRHYYQFKSTKGNVTGQLVASYEYDAFGREVRAWGLNTPTENQPPGLPASRPWADLLPFHYSSKLRDVDSGFNYYGYRFYDPGAGRWLNRDPIGERGGLNLYGMVGNDANDCLDFLGLDVYGLDIGLGVSLGAAITLGGLTGGAEVSLVISKLASGKWYWPDFDMCITVSVTVKIGMGIGEIGVGSGIVIGGGNLTYIGPGTTVSQGGGVAVSEGRGLSGGFSFAAPGTGSGVGGSFGVGDPIGPSFGKAANLYQSRIYSEKICEPIKCWDPTGAFALAKLIPKIGAATDAAIAKAKADKLGTSRK